MLLAYQPEGLIAVAILTVVVGLSMPVFDRFGFGPAVSAGLGLAAGILVIAGLAAWPWLADTLNARARRRRPSEPPVDGRDDPAESGAPPDTGRS